MTLDEKKAFVSYVMKEMKNYQIDSFDYEGLKITRPSKQIMNLELSEYWKAVKKGDNTHGMVGTRKFKNPLES